MIWVSKSKNFARRDRRLGIEEREAIITSRGIVLPTKAKLVIY